MSIKVRYFASLKERLGRDYEEMSADAITCVGDVWARANPGLALPDNMLAAVNMEYGNSDTPVTDGDEVAFFPPVTGG